MAKWVISEANPFHTTQEAEYATSGQRRWLLPQILSAPKLEDQTPEKMRRRCETYMF